MAEKKPSYWEQLRDPRWQQMRLRVMDLHKWTCQKCGDKTTTFNVHHSYYERGLAPWEYPIESLRCLCEPCHEKAQDRMKVLQREIGKLPHSEIDRVIGFLRGVQLKAGVITEAIIDGENVDEGIAQAWGCEVFNLWCYSGVSRDGKDDAITADDFETMARERAEAAEIAKDERERELREQIRTETASGEA